MDKLHLQTLRGMIPLRRGIQTNFESSNVAIHSHTIRICSWVIDIPFRSPLIRESQLISFPRLSNMLKFSRWFTYLPELIIWRVNDENQRSKTSLHEVSCYHRCWPAWDWFTVHMGGFETIQQYAFGGLEIAGVWSFHLTRLETSFIKSDIKSSINLDVICISSCELYWLLSHQMQRLQCLWSIRRFTYGYRVTTSSSSRWRGSHHFHS